MCTVKIKHHGIDTYVTLFSLLIILAIERVAQKSPALHIATIAKRYFNLIAASQPESREQHDQSDNPQLSTEVTMLKLIVIVAFPALIAYLVLDNIPGLFVFLINLLVLWVCIGCPVTRHRYKQYLRAAHEKDYQACALHSMTFGNAGYDLNDVGKQLVLVNFRQYAAVVITFVIFGIPGVIIYSLVKEWAAYELSQHESATLSDAIQTLLHLVDFIPVRVVTLGFLVVGNFSNALSAWLGVISSIKISAYDALASVALAAEDVSNCDVEITQPKRLVRLVKRNVMFILVLLSLATMVGLVA